MSLASLMADSGRTEEGWQYMDRAVKAAPDNTNVLNNLGAYLLRLGKFFHWFLTYELNEETLL